VFTAWIPKYLKDELDFSLEDSGIFSFLPYIFIPMIGIPSGMIVDATVRYNIMKLQNIRKIFAGLSMFIPSIFLLMLAFMTHLTVPVALTIMTLAISLAAFAGGGYQGNHVDLSTKYCGMLWGFTNTISTLPGIVGVSVTGYILQESGWSLVFLIAAIIYVSSGILYIIFGNAEQLNFEVDMPVETQPLKYNDHSNKVDKDTHNGEVDTEYNSGSFGSVNNIVFDADNLNPKTANTWKSS